MKKLWELLVPTVMDRGNGLVPIKVKYHRVWDEKVRKITHGMTILTPVKGAWVSPNDKLFVERMIPVRIYCTTEEINLIADMSAMYYNQEAIMYYALSDEVKIKYYKKEI